MTHTLLYIATAAALTLGQQAAAQTALTLEQCLDLAERNNLTLRQGRIAVARAQDLQATAVDLDATQLTLSQDPTSGGSPDNALTIGQTVALPTVYVARRRELKALTAVERGRLELTRAELTRDVTAAYCHLVYQLARRDILQRHDTLCRRFVHLAAARLTAGEGGRLEKINIDRMAADCRVAVSEAERDCRAAQYALMAWLNTDEAIVPADDSLAVMPMTALTTAGTTTPTVAGGATTQTALLALEQTAAERSLATARCAYLPTLSLAARTQLVLRGFNPYDVDRSRFADGNFMGFEIGLNIPLAYAAQRAKVRAAKRDVEMAAAQREQLTRELLLDRRAATDDYLHACERLAMYGTEADDIETISRVAYENGAIDYVELIQNMQTAQQLRLGRAEAVNGCNQAAVRLNYYTR